jgi:transposase InsO family protein
LATPCAHDVLRPAWCTTPTGAAPTPAPNRQALVDRGLVASMSRTGDCYDNAVAESFFATLKAEHVDHEDFATRAIGTASIGDYVERFYNTARRHSHLGYVSPIEFELRSQTGAIAAPGIIGARPWSTC